MAKHIFQDIIPPDKRSIKRIPLPDRQHDTPHQERPQQHVHEEPAEFRYVQDDIRSVPHEIPDEIVHTKTQSRPRGSRRSIWGVAIIVLFCVIGAVFLYFGGATVTVTPKTEPLAINVSLTASKDAAADLSYSVMTLSRDGTSRIDAVKEEIRDEKASGRIVIFNNHSNSPQTLVANTRFETPNGLIYRINEQVNVPGTTQENGTTVPGSIEVTVFADEEGGQYNIGLTDFTIPGFEGDPRFTSFYARSKTAMTGGASGPVKVPDEEVAEFERQKLRDSISASLLEEARAQKPDGFVLYEDGAVFEFETLPDASENGAVSLREKVTLDIVLVDTRELEQNIIRATREDLTGSDIRLEGIEDLSFAPASPEEISSGSTTLTFSVSGNVSVVWQINAQKLKADLLNKEKGLALQTLQSHPSISTADIILRPFWKRSMPSKLDGISVVMER